MTVSTLPVSAAGSGFPPVQRCVQCSLSAWSAAAGEKAAAAGSAHWSSDKPGWCCGASLAEKSSEGTGNKISLTREFCLNNQIKSIKIKEHKIILLTVMQYEGNKDSTNPDPGEGHKLKHGPTIKLFYIVQVLLKFCLFRLPVSRHFANTNCDPVSKFERPSHGM